MTTFNIASPDQGLAEQIEVRMRSFEFGDGYKQQVANGINNTKSTFSAVWSGRTQATIQAIDDFFRAQAGAPFTWTTPRGTTVKFTCTAWAPNYQVSTSCSLTATLEQSFEP